MKLKTTLYSDYEKQLPQEGNWILAQQKPGSLIIYQAFNPRIASYAVQHQAFGGDHYKFSRMSWIKPNFLWMMYRCGWAMKENQKKVLAIEISKSHFEEILSKAVHSSFNSDVYTTRENWQEALANSEVRLQWDPDHNPKGGKLSRRAIQLGLKGATLKNFATQSIISIEDITDFVLEEGQKVLSNDLAKLRVAAETIYEVQDTATKKKLQIK